MSSEEKRDPLPFEPRQKRKKKSKQAQAPLPPDRPQDVKSPTPSEASPSAIPDAVSQRMIRRMAFFSGIPTSLGLSSFLLFYWVVRQEWFEVPTVAVLSASATLFGLGFFGLSYGLLSTSWDENRVGDWLGLEEFKLNFGRMAGAWRSARKEAKGERSR